MAWVGGSGRGGVVGEKDGITQLNREMDDEGSLFGGRKEGRADVLRVHCAGGG